nr:DUF6883 domain-containing protein [Trichocoleus sp. FACHB-46]
METAKRILSRIQAWWPIAEQVRGGTEGGPPVATLILPQTVWDDLTQEQQVSLTFYAENMVDDVRNNPEKYSDIPSSDPNYPSLLANYRCIRDGFWQIIIGRFFNEEPKRLMVDETVVQGDAFWNFNQNKVGTSASSFRQPPKPSSSTKLIPNAENAVVDIRKLRDYCLNLNHDQGKHKARLFSSILCMSSDDAKSLCQILLEVVKTQEARLGRRDDFGQRYTLDFTLEWQGRSASVRSGWIVEHNSNIPKLTTCYPL